MIEHEVECGQQWEIEGTPGSNYVVGVGCSRQWVLENLVPSFTVGSRWKNDLSGQTYKCVSERPGDVTFVREDKYGTTFNNSEADARRWARRISDNSTNTPNTTEGDFADLVNVSAHKPKPLVLPDEFYDVLSGAGISKTKPTAYPTQYRRAPNGRGYRVLDVSSELALMRQDDGLRVTAPLATVASWVLEDGPETMTLSKCNEARGRLALEWPLAGETRTETLRRVTGSVELPPAWMWESGQPSPWEGAVRL